MPEDKKMSNNKLGIIILTVCVFAIGFVSGRAFQGSGVSLISQIQSEKNVNMDLFWQVWTLMTTEYVESDKVTEEDMVYGAIKGMVDSFDDPATVFLTPEETEEFNATSEGKYFEGIGAELGYADGAIIIVTPLEGSPAKEAGIRAGDYILSIDGEDLTTEDTVYDAVAKIRGEAGTEVVLTILHKGETESTDISITRREITVPSMDVSFIENNKVAYLDVDRFTDSSYAEWINNWNKNVDQIVESGVDKMILDLRGNPGGFFDAAIYAADDFLDSGYIISQQRDGEGNIEEFKSSKGGKLLDIELIILVDEGSASASEILSGALQQSERATVVGMETYGKGTAQSVKDLASGSSLHITILKWLLPDGEWLNTDNPIVPDVKIDLTNDDFIDGLDPQLDKAIEILSK